MTSLRSLRLETIVLLIITLGWTLTAEVKAKPATLNEPCQLESSDNESFCLSPDDCDSLSELEKFDQPLRGRGNCSDELICCPSEDEDSEEISLRLLTPSQNRRFHPQTTKLFPSSQGSRNPSTNWGSQSPSWGSQSASRGSQTPSWGSRPSARTSQASLWNSQPPSWGSRPNAGISQFNSPLWGSRPATGISQSSLWNSQPSWGSQSPSWGSRPSVGVSSIPPIWNPRPTAGNPLPTPPTCGIMLSDRIHGGNLTALDEFPWTARLEYSTPSGKSYNCGGSLIADRWVLTAAHCVTGRALPSNWRMVGVRLGEWNEQTNPDCMTLRNGRRDCAPEPVDVRVTRWFAHPLFDSRSKAVPNDIALLQLERPVLSTQFVRPICLPQSRVDRERNYAGATAIVSGWGRTEHNNQPSPVKLKAALSVWPTAECVERYRRELNMTTKQMCAGGVRGIDACQGDSGGPLMVEQDEPSLGLKVFRLVGVVSIGRKQCGTGGYPGIYTRVGAYVDWIEQTMAQHS